MRAFASMLAAAVLGGCSAAPASGPNGPPGPHQNGGFYFDAYPPFGSGGAGGYVPMDARTLGTGGAGGAMLVDAQPDDALVQPVVDGAPKLDTTVARLDGPLPKDTAPPPDLAKPDTTVDTPPVRPDVNTVVLDLSQMNFKGGVGPLLVSGYGLIAFPFNPTVPLRKLTTVSASTVVHVETGLTCHASGSEITGKLGNVTGQGNGTVLELRIDMPHRVPQDDKEHLPGQFCVGYRSGGRWSWQPMPMFARLQRDIGRSYLIATIGPAGGAAGVDALAVLAEGGATVKTIEIDLKR